MCAEQMVGYSEVVCYVLVPFLLHVPASKFAVFPDRGKTTDDHSFFVPSDSSASHRRHNCGCGLMGI